MVLLLLYFRGTIEETNCTLLCVTSRCNVPLLFASVRKACVATAGNVSGIDVAEVDRSKSRPNYVRCVHWGRAPLIRGQLSLYPSQSRDWEGRFFSGRIGQGQSLVK